MLGAQESIISISQGRYYETLRRHVPLGVRRVSALLRRGRLAAGERKGKCSPSILLILRGVIQQMRKSDPPRGDATLFRYLRNLPWVFESARSVFKNRHGGKIEIAHLKQGILGQLSK